MAYLVGKDFSAELVASLAKSLETLLAGLLASSVFFTIVCASYEFLSRVPILNFHWIYYSFS